MLGILNSLHINIFRLGEVRNKKVSLVQGFRDLNPVILSILSAPYTYSENKVIMIVFKCNSSSLSCMVCNF